MNIRNPLSSLCIAPAYVAVNVNRRRLLQSGFLAVGAVGAAGSVLVLAGCGEKPSAFSGIDITGADYATAFQLTDHNGILKFFFCRIWRIQNDNLPTAHPT